MNRPRLFKKEYAKELLNLAYSDLETASVLEKANLPRKENILFHAQQSIEKAVKAVICHHGLPVPMVQDLNELVKTVPAYEQIPYHDVLFDFTQFATIRRYEEGVAIISVEEVSDAIKVASKVCDWVKGQVIK